MRKDLAVALKNKDMQIGKLRGLVGEYKERIIKLEIKIARMEKEIENLRTTIMQLDKSNKELEEKLKGE